MFPKGCFFVIPRISRICCGRQSLEDSAHWFPGGVLRHLSPGPVTGFLGFPRTNIIVQKRFGLPTNLTFACTLWCAFFTSPSVLSFWLSLWLLCKASEALLLFPKAPVYPLFLAVAPDPFSLQPSGYSLVSLLSWLLHPGTGILLIPWGMNTRSHLGRYT